MAKKSKNKRIRRTASNVILVCLIAIFLVSAYNVAKILLNYNKDRNTYKEVEKIASEGEFTGDIDFDSLREINPGIVGWIYLKDTIINYPIVKAPDNEKYLSVKFDGTWGGCGTLFTDCATEAPFDQFLTIVYGHHMRDGSMFNKLKKFKDPDYAKDHGRFELITPSGKFHLDVVAFCNQKSDSDLYQPNIRTEEGRESYINLINKRAEYTTGVEFGKNDQLVLLSTCAYEFKSARYMVIGKMIPWEKDKNK